MNDSENPWVKDRENPQKEHRFSLKPETGQWELASFILLTIMRISSVALLSMQPMGLPALLDRQQQVNEAGALVARYLHSGGDPGRLLAALGNVLLREDREFHTIQTMEGAFRQHALLRGTAAGVHALVAAARYLAAHAPTVRSQEQTYQIARRLSRGERLFEES